MQSFHPSIKVYLFIFIFLICGVIFLYGQTNDLDNLEEEVGGLYVPRNQLIEDQGVPAWVLVEEGKHALFRRDVSSAVALFREALDRERTLPEARVGLGMAYLGSGDHQLAIRELELAFEQQNYLYTANERYNIMYTLADAYRLSGQIQKMQQILLDISNEDPYYIDEEGAVLRRNYRRALQQNGINELFRLYRLPEIYSRRSHHELGIQFLQQNLPSQAVDHLLIAVLMGFSDVIDEVRYVLPDFRYESIEQTYQRIFSDDPRLEYIREYLLQDHFTTDLLYLADALYIEGQTALAMQIYQLVSRLPGPEQIRLLAQRQAEDPVLPEVFNVHIDNVFEPK